MGPKRNHYNIENLKILSLREWLNENVRNVNEWVFSWTEDTLWKLQGSEALNHRLLYRLFKP